MTNRDTVVLGLGNPLMADEGVGCRVIQELLKRAEEYPNAEFLDAGTAGFSLLHHLANRRKAIIIDCAFMDTEPGTVRKFTPDDVQTVKKLAHFSLHEADVLKIIGMAKQLQQCPEHIVIFGIEPQTVSQNPELSDVLSKKIDHYSDLVLDEIAGS